MLLCAAFSFSSFSASGQKTTPIKADQTITLAEASYAFGHGHESYPTPQILKTMRTFGPLFSDPTSFSWVKYNGVFFGLSMELPIFVAFKPNGELIADYNLEPTAF